MSARIEGTALPQRNALTRTVVAVIVAAAFVAAAVLGMLALRGNGSTSVPTKAPAVSSSVDHSPQQR